MRHCIIVVGGHINDIFAKEFIEKEDRSFALRQIPG